MTAILAHLRATAAIVLCVHGVLAGACSSSTTERSTSPSPTKCRVTAASEVASIAASGGTARLTITAQPECTWRAEPGSNWITELKPTQGQGDGQIEARVPANPTPAARQGTVTVNDTSIAIAQDAAPCQFQVAPRTATLGSGGGDLTVQVTAMSGCSWTATSHVGWMSVTSGGTGNGSGNVRVSVSSNNGTGRSGTLTIAGQTVSVDQAAASTSPGSPGACTYTVSPASHAASAAGGAFSTSVTATSSCAWTAISHDSWITVTGGASGSGNGNVALLVAANAGAARTGTLTIASQTVTVNQAAASTSPGSPPACAYTVSPASHAASPAGGAFSTSVTTTTSSCAWTATSHDGWITITAGASGSGNGNVALLVAANAGPARTGTLTIAGSTHSVNQAAITPAPAPCSYAINPTSQNVAASGGAGSPISVASGSGCAWTATSNSSWLTVTSGGAGSGNGSVGFSAAANGGSARSGSLTVAGQTFTVNQAAAVCSPSINPTSQSIGAAGGPGTPIAVAASSGCAWSANSQVSWVTITSGSAGNGNGTVSFIVGPNSGSARSGALVVAGQTFTVNQSAPCSFSINPNNASFSNRQGSGTVAVSAGATCPWTAVSNASWITVTSGATGVGSGTVGYSVSRNRDDQRVGTITIAGLTFTVQQDEDD